MVLLLGEYILSLRWSLYHINNGLRKVDTCVCILALSILTVAVQFILKSGKYKLFYLFKIVLIIGYMHIKSSHMHFSQKQ